MKKFLALIALVAVAGCASYYDYYKGGVRYTQDGEDCIYYSGEFARHYSNKVNAADLDKKIVVDQVGFDTHSPNFTATRK